MTLAELIQFVQDMMQPQEDIRGNIMSQLQQGAQRRPDIAPFGTQAYEKPVATLFGRVIQPEPRLTLKDVLSQLPASELESGGQAMLGPQTLKDMLMIGGAGTIVKRGVKPMPSSNSPLPSTISPEFKKILFNRASDTDLTPEQLQTLASGLDFFSEYNFPTEGLIMWLSERISPEVVQRIFFNK